MRAFVIAMEREANAVKPFLKEGDVLYVSGIGKVNAAAATQKAIDRGADEIINAGVAGGFGEGINVGDIFEISSAVEYDFDLSGVNGTSVGQLDEYDSPYLPLVRQGVYKSCRLASGDRFSDKPDDADFIASLGCSVRDMEGAAIAHVCKKNGVRFRAVKCITNVAGKGAMTGQYEANRETALARLAEAMKEYV